MRKDLTDITVVLDRSGSMNSCREDAEGGLNEFVQKQKQDPGDTNFTLVQFDTDYEFVHTGIPIAEVPRCTLEPRGGTALLDAIGRAVGHTGDRLRAITEADRPGLVVFVIITDGGENSSREFKRAQIKEMIERQERDYNWKFTYLGANQDAFAEGASMGFARAATAGYDIHNVRRTYQAAGAQVSDMKRAVADDQIASFAYSQEDREAMTKIS